MTTATDIAAIDPRPIDLGATEWVTALMKNVSNDQLALPTPCDEFYVRTLQSHLVATVGRLIAIGEFGSPDSVAPLGPDYDAASFARLADQGRSSGRTMQS